MNESIAIVGTAGLIGLLFWMNVWPWLRDWRYVRADFSYVSRFTITNTSVDITTSILHRELGELGPQLIRAEFPGIGRKTVRWVQVEKSAFTYRYVFEFQKPLVGKDKTATPR